MKNYFYLRSKAEKLFQQNSFMALFFLLAVPLVLPAQGTYPQSLIWSVPSQQIN